MARMTKEQRNKRRSDLRFQEKSRRLQSAISEFTSLYINAKQDHLSHSEICDHRNRIIASPRLTWREREYLSGAFDLLISLMYREVLTWTVELDGKRIATRVDSSDYKYGQSNPALFGRWSEAKNGEHAYRLPDGSYKPWANYSRDLETGKENVTNAN